MYYQQINKHWNVWKPKTYYLLKLETEWVPVLSLVVHPPFTNIVVNILKLHTLLPPLQIWTDPSVGEPLLPNISRLLSKILVANHVVNHVYPCLRDVKEHTCCWITSLRVLTTWEIKNYFPWLSFSSSEAQTAEWITCYLC